MAEPLRHRQTKEAATDMFYLKPPRHISTLPFASVWPDHGDFRGRDASYLAPPAQIRTGPIRAYGLYGAFFVKEASRHFCRPLSFHSFVRPAPQVFFRPDRRFASPSRAAAVKDGASLAPPKACP